FDSILIGFRLKVGIWFVTHDFRIADRRNHPALQFRRVTRAVHSGCHAKGLPTMQPSAFLVPLRHEANQFPAIRWDIPARAIARMHGWQWRFRPLTLSERPERPGRS